MQSQHSKCEKVFGMMHACCMVVIPCDRVQRCGGFCSYVAVCCMHSVRFPPSCVAATVVACNTHNTHTRVSPISVTLHDAVFTHHDHQHHQPFVVLLPCTTSPHGARASRNACSFTVAFHLPSQSARCHTSKTVHPNIRVAAHSLLHSCCPC